MLVGCSREREVWVDLRWDLTDTGACAPAPGETAEKEITFRYIKSPAYFETVCSTRIANHLAASGKNPVPAMFLYSRSTRGRSLCEIDGIKGTLLGGVGGKSCTDLGHRSGGTMSVGGGTIGPNPLEMP